MRAVAWRPSFSGTAMPSGAQLSTGPISSALRADQPERASQLRTELEVLVGQHGFREFYDAFSGDPGGAGAESGFTWPALLLEMEANERSGLDTPI